MTVIDTAALVERLRDPIECVLPIGCENLDLLNEAAGRIEALEAEVQFRVKSERAATQRADELADQAMAQADRIKALTAALKRENERIIALETGGP